MKRFMPVVPVESAKRCCIIRDKTVVTENLRIKVCKRVFNDKIRDFFCQIKIFVVFGKFIKIYQVAREPHIVIISNALAGPIFAYSAGIGISVEFPLDLTAVVAQPFHHFFTFIKIAFVQHSQLVSKGEEPAVAPVGLDILAGPVCENTDTFKPEVIIIAFGEKICPVKVLFVNGQSGGIAVVGNRLFKYRTGR